MNVGEDVGEDVDEDYINTNLHNTYLDRFRHTTPNHKTTTINMIILTAHPIINPRSAVELNPKKTN